MVFKITNVGSIPSSPVFFKMSNFNIIWSLILYVLIKREKNVHLSFIIDNVEGFKLSSVEALRSNPNFFYRLFFHHPVILDNIKNLCKYYILCDYELHKINYKTSPDFLNLYYNKNYDGVDFHEDLIFNLFSNHFINIYEFKCKHLTISQYLIFHLNFFKMVYSIFKLIPPYTYMYVRVITKDEEKELRYAKSEKTFY